MTPIDKTPFICLFFFDILHNFQLALYTKMRLRAIVHNDVTYRIIGNIRLFPERFRKIQNL